MSSLPTYTGATRPSSPSAGDAIYLSDVNKLAVYDGDISDWRIFNSDSVLYNSAAPNELHYAGGIYDQVSANYYLDVSPTIHLDGAFIDGSDATNNPASGSAVSTWVDRSGGSVSYNLTQSTGSAQATFDAVTEGKNSLSFSAGDNYSLSSNYTGAAGQDYTAVYVAKIPGTTNGAVRYAPFNNGNNTSTIWFNAQTHGDLVQGNISRGFTSGNQSSGTTMPTLFNPLHLFIIQRSSDTVTGYTGGNNQQWSYGSVTNAVTISNFGNAQGYNTEGSFLRLSFSIAHCPQQI